MRSEDAKLSITSSLPLFALFAVVSLIAAFAYGISAWQVYGFADHVWGLPLPLRFASAVIADLLSLAGLFATYLLRTASLRVRAYAWSVFLLMTALSIAAAEAFAHWRTLDPDAQEVATHQGGLASQVASGAVVVSLALAVHLLIVVRRHVMEPPTAAAARTPTNPAATVAPPLARTPATAAPKPIAAQQPKPVVAPANKPAGKSPEARDAFARRVVEQGERPADIAVEAGVSKRAVEMWAGRYRERHPDRPPSMQRIEFDITPDQHLNGAAPDVTVGA